MVILIVRVVDIEYYNTHTIANSNSSTHTRSYTRSDSGADGHDDAATTSTY